MPRNSSRQLIESKAYGFVQVDLYSSGAVYFRWIDRRDILLLTNAKELFYDGYIEKIAQLLIDEEASELIASYSRGLTLEYVPQRMELGLKYIIDSELDVDSKLVYLISLLKLGFPLGAEELQVIFEKRPSPRTEWSRYASVYTLSKEGLIRGALMSGFTAAGEKEKTVNDYKRLCRTSAFIFSEKAVTHQAFMESHEKDFFVPHLAVNAGAELFARAPKLILADLFPAEYTRFMSYFVQGCPQDLLPWAKHRLLQGVVTTKEARAKGSVELKQGNIYNWLPVIDLLSVAEANEFQQLLKEPNGVSSLVNGSDTKSAPLMAYYFAEGGRKKFHELVAHILDNGPGVRQEFYQGTLIKLNWSNPYSDSKGYKPRLAPYVKALEPELREYPLEWSLASL